MSLPSLIDVIFLLLIFFMATINMSTVVSDRNRGIYTQKKFDLPEIRNRQTGPVQDILQTLMFQIEHADPQDNASPMVVYALWPSRRDSLTVARARDQAAARKMVAYFVPDAQRNADPDIPNISPYDFITREINRYADQYFRTPNPKNYIEIRAVKETEFKTINHILNACSELEDRIPRIYVRTLSGELGADVF
ncbi:biopolymer transporter ExbD [bacterium]|nr:biopolymer transporter ExbD [bacterium]